MTARLRTINDAVVKAVGGIRLPLRLHDAVTETVEAGSTAAGGEELVSFGARFAMQRVRGDAESLKALQSLLQAGPESENEGEGGGEGCTWYLPALAPAYEAVDKFTTVAGSLMLEVCTLLPRKVLSDVGDDAAWGARSGGGAEDDSDLLPGTAFTHVGEHLLSLVQELEAFAASTALQDLLHVSVRSRSNYLEGLTASTWVGAVGGGVAGVTAEGLRSLAERGAAAAAVRAVEAAVFSRTRTDSGEDGDGEGDGDENGDRDGGRGRSASSVSAVAATAAAALRPQDIEAGGEMAELAALGLANEWLGAMADAITGLVLAQVLRITKLSALGRRQLDTDVAYLRNVVAAIGLAAHPVLEHLSQLLSATAVGADGTKVPSLLMALDAMGATTLAEMTLKEVDRKVMVSFV
jgi:hypothetical protein